MLLFFRLTYVCKYRDIIELSNSFKKKNKNFISPIYRKYKYWRPILEKDLPNLINHHKKNLYF